MNRHAKARLIAGIIGATVVVDQGAKVIARALLASSPGRAYLGDTLRLHFSENTGAFLSLGADWPYAVRFWTLIVAVSAVLIGFLVFIWQTSDLGRRGIVGGALTIGGGLSNLLDRLYNDGAVVDFMNIGIGNLRTGIFNVADLGIVFGIGLLALSSLQTESQHTPEPAE
ncbi:MAG: signal peptidase II [Anaerolineae bacterium]|nr:signal peptidase II [Anaerolineae bacterium]